MLLIRRPSLWWIVLYRWKRLVFPAALLLGVYWAWPSVAQTPTPALRFELFGRVWTLTLPVLAVLWMLVVLELQVLGWLCRMYVLTERRVLVVVGIISRDTGDVPLENIQHEIVTQSWWERLLGLGTVGIATAGTGTVLRWLSVSHPDRVLSAMRGAIDRARRGGNGRPTAGLDAAGLGRAVSSGSVGAGDGGVGASRPEGGTGAGLGAGGLAGAVAGAAMSAVMAGGGSSGATGNGTSGGGAGAVAGRASSGRWCPIIGLCGGIGSGKSAAARAFERLGCVVIDSDREARAVLDRPEVREELVRWWGPGILGADGRVHRPAVADRVFSDPAERHRLESLVHPLVRARRADLAARAASTGAAGVVVDAPLLFEAGVDSECDAVVFIDTPRDVRLARVMATRGWTEAELDRREASQWPLEEKRARSSHVVRNTGDLAELERKVGAAFSAIVSAGPVGSGPTAVR